jgi:hypothetical protein
MGVSRLGIAAIGFVLPVLAGLYACGSSSPAPGFGGSSGSGGSGAGSGAGDDSGLTIPGDDSGTFGFGDGFAAGDVSPQASGMAIGTLTAPDCNGCKFPDKNAQSCASSAPAIQLRYPIDGVLLPPNMNTLSVQWTPFGGYTTYEVDFTNNVTDTRVITKCSTQTMDTSQPSVQSGGCEIVLNAGLWGFLSTPNRGGPVVTVTVRGTTDGMCASTSANSVKMLFAEEDVLGAIYYWKSTISSNGTGGQIWVKSFGDNVAEQQVTGGGNGPLASSCNGCHALSRDGLRMVVYSDDDDSDDEYEDVQGSLIDMTTKMLIGGGGGGRGGGGGGGNQPPGFSTFAPTHTNYLTSNGTPNGATNVLTLWSGNTGTQTSTITLGTNAADRPTMPDWSPDGKSVVYVLPNKVANWVGTFGGQRNDDDHEFGGSLYTVPYMGNNAFGNPAVFLTSKGENNYYPSYSPDGQFIVFDRTPQDTGGGAIESCTMSPHPLCPNDSFSNPKARLMLTPATAAAPIDLERANGSPAAAPQPLSNSWPRWSPFVQMYHGNRLLWVAFSSTRDYGVRVRNHLTGMYQCYPADSDQNPGTQHHGTFDPLCQQPKLWMAAINLSETQGVDPSFPAFYLPFQDITTHNHTPQWTQQIVTKPPPPPSMCLPAGGNCTSNVSACCSTPVMLTCTGTGVCGQVVN